MEKTEIIAALEAAGIEHDKRQATEKLAALLPGNGVQAVVVRDFWPTDDEEDRVCAGQVITVSKDDLISGLEKGTLARVK